MRARSRATLLVLGFASVGVLVAGCAAKHSPSRQADMQDGAPAGAEAQGEYYQREALEEAAPSDGDLGSEDDALIDDLAAAQAELERYEARLWQVGVPVGAYAQRTDTAARGEPDPFPGVAREKELEREEAKRPAKKSKPKASSKAGRADKKKGKKRKSGGASKDNVPYDDSAAVGGDQRLAKNRDEQDRCETVCELASAICELETRICSMADRHPEDPRYRDACERASEDCRVASEACQACSSG